MLYQSTKYESNKSRDTRMTLTDAMSTSPNERHEIQTRHLTDKDIICYLDSQHNVHKRQQTYHTLRQRFHSTSLK